VQEARLASIRQRGGSPFNEDQLPRAITILRQGVGRLIRDAGDRGLVVLCDPRLVSRSYGRRVLEALPAMPLVDREEALRWLGKLRVAA
jgi:ATP-dependent DNA helicase DinG